MRKSVEVSDWKKFCGANSWDHDSKRPGFWISKTAPPHVIHSNITHEEYSRLRNWRREYQSLCKTYVAARAWDDGCWTAYADNLSGFKVALQRWANNVLSLWPEDKDRAITLCDKVKNEIKKYKMIDIASGQFEY